MDIIGQVIIHKIFGKGTVTACDGRYLSVQFNNAVKIFPFPDAFKGFLTAEDNVVQDKILQEIDLKDAAEKQRIIEKALLEEKALKIKIAQNVIVNGKRINEYPKSNVAFKCNYCDGGSSGELIGFNGVCSDAIMLYNIEIEHRSWCSSEDCPCCQYLGGEMSRTDLEAYMKDSGNSGYVCYESSMLRDWRAAAGVVQTGVNKGKPMKMNQVQVNSLCVLTARMPYDSGEKYRQIFAVFLVDETYEGDNREEGYVTTSSKYKIKLSPKEAQKILFWNYHSNENKPESALWSSGLHRYFDDIQAVQILRDIAFIKIGTADEQLAFEFINYFCDISNIDISDVPKPNGSIKKA